MAGKTQPTQAKKLHNASRLALAVLMAFFGITLGMAWVAIANLAAGDSANAPAAASLMGMAAVVLGVVNVANKVEAQLDYALELERQTQPEPASNN